MTKKRIITSKELWMKLTQGEYKKIIEYASKRENDLDVQIRDNYLNIYYRGGNLLRIHPRSLFFDEFYFHRGSVNIRKTRLIERANSGDQECMAKWDSYKRQRNDVLNLLKEKDGMDTFYVRMKREMDGWECDLNKIGIYHDEKNEQQHISMNNRGNTLYTVIDLEYAVSTTSNFHYNGKLGKKVPRFDIIAVDKEGQLYVIELKTGLGAIANESGIGPHMDCFEHSIGRDEQNEFANEMHDQLEQKKSLHLIDKTTYIDINKKPQFIFAFSDKPGENHYKDFIQTCKDKGYTGKVIYLDNSHVLKDL